jgi:hypothetical protein
MSLIGRRKISCQKSSTQVSQKAATRSGISASANLLASRRAKQIFFERGETTTPAGLLTVRQGKQKWSAQSLEIDGSAQVGIEKGGVLIKTRAPVRLTAKNDDQQQAEPTRPVSAERAAVAANVKRFHRAIQEQRKVTVRYRSAKGMRQYTLIPLDVKGGRSERTKKNRYMWGYSEKSQGVMCLRLERVLHVTSQPETFEPEKIGQKAWSGKTIAWNLPREWPESGNSGEEP